MLIQQEQTITMLTRHDAMIAHPIQQFASNGLCLGIGIGLLLGQDMPYCHQQFASDGDNR